MGLLNLLNHPIVDTLAISAKNRCDPLANRTGNIMDAMHHVFVMKMPAELHARLKTAADSRHTSMADLARGAIEDGLRLVETPKKTASNPKRRVVTRRK